MNLHLFSCFASLKTPTSWAVMNGKGGLLCASEMRKGVNKLLFVLCLLISIFVCSYFITIVIENFDVVQDVDFYIITMKTEERMQNINTQLDRLRNSQFSTKNVELVDAVVGKDLDLDQLIQEGILDLNGFNGDADPAKRRQINQREVGCYMSHIKSMEIVANKNKPGYSVILEDDFVLTDDFLNTLDKTLLTLKNIEFDMFFLGIWGNKGSQVIDNVYNILPSFGTHGYLINNQSAYKIKKQIQYMDTTVDVSMFNKGISKDLIIYRIDDVIVDQVGLASSIRF